ncbi:sugar porter family MFS transporter [candidate division KSB1 bacterium]|nr:sugar porter family MFS transporter [candidate division KSB1 bacterium]
MTTKSLYIYYVSFVATIGGLLFGFDTAIIAGGLVYLKDFFTLNAVQEGWAVGSALVGCIAGAAIAGVVSDAIGRKKLLVVSAVLFIVSAVGSALPETLFQFIIFRFIGGIGVGAASMLSPLYIAEISPPRIRGSLVSLNQLAIVSGMLAAYFVDWICAGLGPSNWRWMFGSETLPAALFLLLLIFVPESPRWLIKKERDGEALAVLTKVNTKEIAQKEVRDIRETIKLESGSMLELVKPGFRIALIIGMALAVFQQITGINTVLYYAPRIFENAGFERVSALLQAVLVGLVNLVFTLVAIFTIDRVGRKPLLLVASVGMGVSFLLVGLFFRLDNVFWILVFIFTYVAFFALAMGSVVWVVLSEIFPTRIRGRAMSIATVLLWASCLAVSVTFPVMADRLSEATTFRIYAVMCFLCFVFVWWILPETKGKSLEEIERYWIRR